jgi:adenosylcobinamide kinase/adenosylcobinamide-phosphate guanylyltransferase
MGTRVLGGARSGKTRWAQQFAEKFERVAYVANLMAAAEADPSSAEGRIEEFLAELRTTSSSIVLVSREVGSGVVLPSPPGRQYRDALGELNQRGGAIANNVVLMVAGFPLGLKGSIGARP